MAVSRATNQRETEFRVIVLSESRLNLGIHEHFQILQLNERLLESFELALHPGAGLVV